MLVSHMHYIIQDLDMERTSHLFCQVCCRAIGEVRSVWSDRSGEGRNEKGTEYVLAAIERQ
jgi:hypothetical protein